MYQNKTLVLIFCMHRSGSSFLANALQRLGMSLGPFELLGPHTSNQHGHFEAIPILKLTRQLQAALLGFPDVIPSSSDLLRQFVDRGGLWLPNVAPTESVLQRGRDLLGQLIDSGNVCGIKDPRVPLLWPFWKGVIAGFPGLRVVPLFLIRSPHEIAMSLFLRDSHRYQDALDVAAIHFVRMFAIMDSWQGVYGVVRFDPKNLAEDLRSAARLCGLEWQEDVLSDVYDSECQHHEQAVVAHRAQELFHRLTGTSDVGSSANNALRLQQDAAIREEASREQVVHLKADAVRQGAEISRLGRELAQKRFELSAALVRVKRFETYPLIRFGLQARHNLRRLQLLAGMAWTTLCREGPWTLFAKSRRRLRDVLRRRHSVLPVWDGVMVSVVIPVYDRTDVLRKSINSILSQDFQDFEVLLACDGSPPETLRVIQEYADHPKVRIFSWPENSGGPVRGRNLMIDQARGKYIAFQDSDDLAEPHRLRVCVEALEEGEADVVYGGFRALTEWNEDWRDHHLQNGQVVLSPHCNLASLRKLCIPIQGTVMARASALRLVGGLKPEMCYREDHELWVRMAARNYRFRALPKVLSSLRLHSANLELKHYQDSSRWHRKLLEVYGERGPLLPRVAFLLPSLDVSGGVAVVLQYAHRLQMLGHEVMVLTVDDNSQCDWFPYRSFRIVPLSQVRGEVLDVLVATFWTTAPLVQSIQAGRKFYFIQSDESRFYPGDEEKQRLALGTYRLDLEMITVARWLQQWLKDRFDRDAHYLPNGIDNSLFHPAAPLESKGTSPRVLLEGPIDLPFKGMQKAFQAVADLDCEVWCVSSAGRPARRWHCDRFLGKVPHFQMKHIYSSCDVLLKMSEVESFCLPPLEMMACGQGACVIGEVTGIDEYVQDGVNALVVKQGDVTAARRAVQRLIEDPELRRRLIENGLKTAQRFEWDSLTARLQEIFFSRVPTGQSEVPTRQAA